MKLKLHNKFGSVLRISIKVWIPSKNAYAIAPAIFDTGAYKTIIDEPLADALNLTVTKKVDSSIVTATGIAETRISTLPRIQMGDDTIRDIPVNVMNLPEELSTRCIIGMNILQEYEITIDNIGKFILLTPKPIPKKYYRQDYSLTLTTAEDGDEVTASSTDNRE